MSSKAWKDLKEMADLIKQSEMELEEASRLDAEEKANGKWQTCSRCKCGWVPAVAISDLIGDAPRLLKSDEQEKINGTTNNSDKKKSIN